MAPFFLLLPNKANEIRPKAIDNITKVKIKKIDENGNPLRGAEFELYRIIDGKEIKLNLIDYNYNDNLGISKILIDNIDAEAIIKNLPEGKYLIREVKSPEGYKITKADYYFIITKNYIEEITIINKKITFEDEEDSKEEKKYGSFKFYKYNKKDNNPLEGAVFKVTKLDQLTGKYIDITKDGKSYTISSNEYGDFKVDNLEYGKYYLWEIKSPEGFKINTTPIEFEIDDISHSKRIDISNEIRDEDEKLISKTGDISFLIASLGGRLMVVIGLYLIKKEDL